MPDPPEARARALLVLGPGGLIGRGVVAEATHRGFHVHAWGRHRFNLRTPAAWPALPAGVETVVHCAGVSDADEAERDERGAMAVNAVALGKLAESCRVSGVRLIHLSCPEVFRGEEGAVHRVEDPHDPVNALGRSKAAGETRVRDSGARWACVRTGWVFAAWGHHCVRTIRRQLSAHRAVEAVTDQVGQPTCAMGLAAFLLDLTEADATGTFHHADAGRASRCDLARAIAAHAGRGDRVVPVDSARFRRPAPRMASAVLDTSETEARCGARRPWAVTLEETLDELDRVDPVGAGPGRG